ncbi:uncharacterized protein G2W53_007220 [Senna tora]|uniref:Uncharacterized protein n=1 Tax=Senna tora TaxID=362788 RepID=A0A834X793_9FABA|nr:uncharacterized protein G2W53_007220 [Senna tora]
MTKDHSAEVCTSAERLETNFEGNLKFTGSSNAIEAVTREETSSHPGTYSATPKPKDDKGNTGVHF